MLKLSSTIAPLSETTEQGTIVRRITDQPNYVPVLRSSEYFLARNGGGVPAGFAGYLFTSQPAAHAPLNSFLLDPEVTFLRHGDVIRISPDRKNLRTLYRRNSRSNSFLVTERCNNFCLMCSQPPKPHDDSYLVDYILRAIPLIAPETREIGLTGGEPTLLENRLIEIVQALKSYLPHTATHILSNGRNFKDKTFAKQIADVGHPDLMIGIPLYSDISSIHDYVVQADGAYDETIRGIINLKSHGVKVEIRIVIHQATYSRLPEIARFIRRNLTFVDQVALMGLEMTGFTKFNLEKLWIDPKDYQPQLVEAAELLDQARIKVSVYNHQLCVLDPRLYPFNRKSISDWKNEYMPECTGCVRKQECGGFFSSAKLRYSSHIRPFQTAELLL
jgi:His-Xaa-Ser system radical SAM maturase HxsC